MSWSDVTRVFFDHLPAEVHFVNVDRVHLSFFMLNLFRSLWAMNQRRFHDKPIIAVIGTTGVGKSQLAVSIAQGLHSQDGPYRRARILSADSMQLYRGLDVITNKVNHEEMGGIEHWGLDMVSPGQGGSWEVGRWCAEASKQVRETPFISYIPGRNSPARYASNHLRGYSLFYPALSLSSGGDVDPASLDASTGDTLQSSGQPVETIYTTTTRSYRFE